MTATLTHRGPDGEGHVQLSGCDLGFRRLSIVDLAAPSPPYPNEDESIWSVCNGEIYNGDELREMLAQKGHRFRTGTDTEVIPHLFEEFGVGMVEHLDGMFAFAVWDQNGQQLLLGRDRAGEKPLFYTRLGQELLFSSELRALMSHSRVEKAVDPVALSRFLLHDFFPAPFSPLAGVRKLPAGHLAIWKAGQLEVRRYWDLADFFLDRPTARPDQVAEELDALLAQAVRRRKKSDVRVGVFLSGGVDSSTILAHMADQEGPGVPVFALGNQDREFDESRHAKLTAAHFGAEFHELVLGEDDLADGLRRVSAGFDEPLGDASIIPTHLLSLFARQRVKVVLSGEGGDELFAGYPTYLGDRVTEIYRKIPGPLRRGLIAAIRAFLPVRMGNNGLDYVLGRFAQGAERERVERHHCWFGSLPPDRQMKIFGPRLASALVGDEPFASARAVVDGRGLRDPLSTLLYTDFSMYLQDDLLTKVDRASMLASLEARAPFLDHQLAEYVAALPSDFKLHGRVGKWILRQAVARRLPAEILTRRKRGFTVPISRWLQHQLEGPLAARFAPEQIAARGLFDPAGISALVEEHRSRRADHKKPLFTLLVFDLWCDRVFGEGRVVPLGPPA